jgi:ribonucleoside-diphosphate reductase alpha chain
VFDRLAGTWTYWGWKGGYFDSEADAQAFFDELRYMLARRCARRTRRSGSTPACTGPTASTGRARVTTTSIQDRQAREVEVAYEHPQPHACFIQGIADDLVNEGGIMDLWVREARLFKYGSGTGTNFSRLRGEGERLPAAASRRA